MVGKLEPPKWAKECKKELIDRNMSIGDLCDVIGYSRQHVSAVINGRLVNDKCKEAMCSYLGVTT